jgi:hypothetical protein
LQLLTSSTTLIYHGHEIRSVVPVLVHQSILV